MKSFRSKKSKILFTCLAVALIASMLCVVLAGCAPLASETPLGVYFVGDFQRDVSPEQLAAITKDGAEIVSVNKAFEEANINPETDPAKAAAAIYALAVTNYNNVTQTGYYVLTNANVSAKGALAGKDVNVSIRSTFSSFSGKNGSFGQTVSGVTVLKGFGSLGDTLRGNFGYNIQNFSNNDFTAFRRGSNGGAQFPDEDDDADVYKYILGAYNKNLSKVMKGDNVTITPADQIKTDTFPEYVQTATTYPENTTLEGKPLPEFNPNRLAWEPLNRIPTRFRNDKGIIQENYTVVEGTRYSYGNYGAGFAVYDFSRPEYLSNNTKVTYNEELDLWTVEVAILDEYVDQACEFAAGDLVKDTQSYIALKNAKFTKISCKFEVYGDGLIKSMQKIDELGTNEPCPLVVIKGECKKGGATSNTATMAFSYSDNDTDATRLAALYWSELGETKIFTNNGLKSSQASEFKLDFTGYETFEEYKPVVNDVLMASFNNIFATKK